MYEVSHEGLGYRYIIEMGFINTCYNILKNIVVQKLYRFINHTMAMEM